VPTNSETLSSAYFFKMYTFRQIKVLNFFVFSNSLCFCLSLHMSNFRSTFLPVVPASVCPSALLSVCLSVQLYGRSSLCLFFCSSVYQQCLSVCLSLVTLCTSVYWPICQCTCRSLAVSVFMLSLSIPLLICLFVPLFNCLSISLSSLSSHKSISM
jgi:hypothetical protein